MATAEMDISIEHDSEELASIYGGVTACIMRITPGLAEELLRFNFRNRPLNRPHASRLSDAMAAGEWWMNGEAIIFSRSGSLLNGQHRLWAIIDSGMTVDVLVVRGIDEDAFKTLDSGRIRKSGEVLSMGGEKNATRIAAAIQAFVTFVDCGGEVYPGTGMGRKATPTTCARVLDVHPGLRDSCREMYRNTLFRSQHAIMLHYLFSRVSPAVAQAFADVLADGHADMGRPFVVFREMLLRERMRTETRRATAAKAIKAFNAEIGGHRPKMFKFLASEDFPTIAGLDYERLAESVE